MREDFFNGAELLGFVVDDEVAFVAELLDVLAENAHAKRMEGANGRSLGLLRFVRTDILRTSREARVESLACFKEVEGR